ncbi:MAG: PDZ domain-containing protein, partial [Gemmatimonadales bacterium]
TRLNAKSLLQSAADVGKDESAPGLRLIELAAKLEPNDTVSLEFRRGKDTKTVQVVTTDEPNVVFEAPDGEDGFAYAFGDEGPFRRRFELQGDLDPDRIERIKGQMDRIRLHGAGGGPFVFALGTALADLELAPIKPDLGRYFGVTQGVLVISVPDDSKLNLKAGDVVLTVDGRAPSNPSHLLRILRSYDHGEEFKIEVMRMKKKETVTGKLSDPDPDPDDHH